MSRFSALLPPSKKFLIVFILSLLAFILYIASVGSSFAVIEESDKRYKNDPQIEYTLGLFQFCVHSTSSSYCSVNGHWNHCPSLNSARAGVAAFTIIAIIIEGIWLGYLIGFKYYITRHRPRQQQQQQPRRQSQSETTNNNINAVPVNGENNGSTTQPAQQQSSSSTTATDELLPSSSSSSFSVSTDCVSFLQETQNFKKIFIMVHIITISCAFLAWAIGFSITGQSHCGKKILDDYVVLASNLTSIESASVGAMAPLSLVGFLFQIACVVVFWQISPECVSGELNHEDVFGTSSRSSAASRNRHRGGGGGARRRGLGGGNRYGDLSDFNQSSGPVVEGGNSSSSNSGQTDYQQVV